MERLSHINSKSSVPKTLTELCQISDMPFDQRSLIHRKAWFPGGPRIPQNPIFLKTEKITKNSKTQKSLEI